MENLYGMLEGMNVLKPIEEQLRNGSFKLTPKGSILVQGSLSPGRSWQLVNGDTQRQCNKWNEIYCKHYKIVPKECRSCWKIVHKMYNLAELFAMVQFLQAHDWIAKCGVDSRQNYGSFGQCTAFFYAPLGKTKGYALKMFRDVKEALAEHYKGDDFQLVLKKGCTEMEALIPSNRWDEHAQEFDGVERALDSLFVLEGFATKENQLLLIDIHQKWIMARAQLGDPTYLQFTGGQPFWRPAVTYHNDSLLEVIE